MELDKEKTYTWHYDAGHAWLEVKKKELIELEVQNRISIFSYINGEIAYLEEDCDASVFITAYEKKTGDRPKYIEKDDGDSSPIRNYNPYQVE